jgi:hypothetical protein
VLRLDGAAQLDSPDSAMSETLRALQYPLAVKPCRGAASRGAKKVNDQEIMRQAICQMEDDGLAKDGNLLETHVDGPEVDANFVLWDGQLLWAEISDDFPCKADRADATVEGGFAEALMLLASSLPPDEVEVLKESLYQSLLKMGFRSGIFHVEARVRNSSISS